MNPAQNRFAIVIITVLFFLWGFALNLNPILIPHLKKACQLSDAQSALIDLASYIAYFLVALPAGLFVRRYSYKAGITLGLLLFAFGTFLFYPAAEQREYSLFLVALFVIASGLTLLETSANPYMLVLGSLNRLRSGSILRNPSMGWRLFWPLCWAVRSFYPAVRCPIANKRPCPPISWIRTCRPRRRRFSCPFSSSA